MLSEFALEDHV